MSQNKLFLNCGDPYPPAVRNRFLTSLSNRMVLFHVDSDHAVFRSSKTTGFKKGHMMNPASIHIIQNRQGKLAARFSCITVTICDVTGIGNDEMEAFHRLLFFAASPEGRYENTAPGQYRLIVPEREIHVISSYLRSAMMRKTRFPEEMRTNTVITYDRNIFLRRPLSEAV